MITSIIFIFPDMVRVFRPRTISVKCDRYMWSGLLSHIECIYGYNYYVLTASGYSVHLNSSSPSLSLILVQDIQALKQELLFEWMRRIKSWKFDVLYWLIKREQKFRNHLQSCKV